MAEPQQLLTKRVWPLCDQLHGAIRAVAGPSRQAQADRLLPGTSAIENALDPSANVQVHLFGFLHGRS